MTSFSTTPVEIEVSEELAKEIATLKEDLERNDSATFDLQGEVDAADQLAESTGKAEDRENAEKLHRQLMRGITSGTALSEKIQILGSDGELERRVNERLANQQSIRRLRMSEEAAKQSKPTPKDQGVPAQYLNDEGTKFRTGMDARLKSDLVASVTGEITKAEPGASLHVFTEAEARKILEARGWTGFLDRKLEILAGKAKAKEAAEAKREEAARERAEAKAKKDAEKAAAKEAAAAEGKASGSKSSSSSKGGTSKTDQARQQREAKAAAGK